MIRYQTLLFGEHANDPLREIVVFDLETTGFSRKEQEIIQIAAAKLKRGKLSKKESFSTFVKPTIAIPREITELTGITRSHVRRAPRIKDALAAFSEFCGDALLVSHNSHCFDMPLLRKTISGIGCRTRQVFYFDSMHLSWHVWGRSDENHALDDVVSRCEVSSSGIRRHDARGDVRLLARCIQRMFSHVARGQQECQVKLYSGLLPFSEPANGV